MLRELTLITLLINAGLLFFAGLPAPAIGLIIFAVLIFLNKLSYSHILNKELSYLAARLTQIMIALFVLFGLLVLLSPLELKESIPYLASVSIALMPLLLVFVIKENLGLSTSQIGQFRNIRILQGLFFAGAGEFILILFGIIGKFEYHLLPAINIIQLLAIEVALILPLAALRHDKNPHKMIKVTDHNLRFHTLGNRIIKSYIGFGLLAAVLAYANYVLLFARHHLNPFYLDPTLPLYKQATSLALLTIVTCFFLGIMFERVDKHDYFINEHTLGNKKLLKAFGFSLIFLVVIIYSPGFKNIFLTAPLDAYDWLTVIAVGVIYSTLRMLKRHTRKHSRHAVIKLHRQVHSAKS